MAGAVAADVKRDWRGGSVSDLSVSNSLQTKSYEIRALVELFRQALVVVGPLAEKAGVNWLQEPSYDDWDAATEGLFRSFLLSALENSNHASAIGKLPGYGFEPTVDRPSLAVERSGQEFGFVQFAGGDRAISKAIICDFANGAMQLVSWNECDLFLRLPDGSRVERIEVAT